MTETKKSSEPEEHKTKESTPEQKTEKKSKTERLATGLKGASKALNAAGNATTIASKSSAIAGATCAATAAAAIPTVVGGPAMAALSGVSFLNAGVLATTAAGLKAAGNVTKHAAEKLDKRAERTKEKKLDCPEALPEHTPIEATSKDKYPSAASTPDAKKSLAI